MPRGEMLYLLVLAYLLEHPESDPEVIAEVKVLLANAKCFPALHEHQTQGRISKGLRETLLDD